MPGRTLGAYLAKAIIALSFPLALLIVYLSGGFPAGYPSGVGFFGDPYFYGIWLMPFLSVYEIVYVLFVHRPRRVSDYLAAALCLMSLLLNAYLFLYPFSGNYYFASRAAREVASYAAAAAGPLMSFFYLAGASLSFFLYSEENELWTREGKGKTAYLSFLAGLGAVVLAFVLFLILYPALGPSSTGSGSSEPVRYYAAALERSRRTAFFA